MVQVSSSVNPNEMGQMPEIGIVVPTIGRRPERLSFGPDAELRQDAPKGFESSS
jgi:hypothetical protein